MSLTPRFLLLAAAVALLAALGIWQAETEPMLARAWMLPAALLLMALLAEQRLAHHYRLQLVRDLPAQVELGRRFEYQLRFQLSPARAVAMQVAEYGASGLQSLDASGQIQANDWQKALSLDHHGQARLEFYALANSLTAPQFNPLKIRVRGLLGLAWWTRSAEADQASLQVIPQVLRHDEIRRLTQNDASQIAKKRGQSYELHSLRDYQPGDAPRSIDWKATARADAIKVRVMHQEQHLELVIALDVGRRSQLGIGQMRRFEHFLNNASRLAQYALHKGDVVHFLAYSNQLQLQLSALQGVRGLQALQRALRNLRADQQESDPLLVAQWMQRKMRKKSLLVLFADTDGPMPTQRLLECVVQLKSRHLAVVAGLLDPDLFAIAEQPELGLDEAQKRWFGPTKRLAALELLAQQKADFQSLSARGARVVSALPEQLDSKVMRAYADVKRRA